MDEQKKRYLTIKVATEKYKLNPEFLSHEQTLAIEGEVSRLYRLQNAILSSDEAQKVTVSSKQIMDVYLGCVQQFETEALFYRSLKHQGITVEGLKFALKDELHCDLILERVAQNIPKLNIEEARQYYAQNCNEFSRGRTWNISQILITTNDEFSENTSDNAMTRIKDIQQKAKQDSFSELALMYSECPSALEKGRLGWCEEGKLYPEISRVLKTLPKGEVSNPILTEIGFHLVICHDERPPYVAGFDEVWPFLQEKHTSRARAYLQRKWLGQWVS